jgi:phage-related minor tail protein
VGKDRGYLIGVPQEDECPHPPREAHPQSRQDARGKKVLLAEKKRDLEVIEAALVEVQAHDRNPQDNRAKLSELIELQERLDEAEAARIAGGRSP